MKQKLIISILSICAIASIGVGSWCWYSTTQKVMPITSVSPDMRSITIKQTPLPETKIVSAGADKGSSEDGAESILVDAKGAVNLYKQQYPAAQIKGITFEEQNGRKSYEVEGVSSEASHSVMIDAMTGKVLKSEVDIPQEVKEDSVSIDLGNLINPDEAKQVAITMLGSGARVLRWELETKGYIAKYHMVLDVLGDTMYVTIDANSSQIVEVTRGVNSFFVLLYL